MRHIPRAAAILLAAMMLAFPATILPASAATPSDIVVVGAVAAPQTLDPQGATAVNDFRILANVFEGLVRFRSGTLEIEPALATSWTISPDGLLYRFELRRDVKFQDGTPFDAASVKFTFDRMLRGDHPFHATGPFPLSFFFSAVDGVTAVDADTVEFRLKQPFAPLLSNLATPTGSIVSPAAVTKYGAGFGRHPVGTGAFAFEAWDANSEVRLSRSATYHGPAPDPKALVFKPLPAPAERLAALAAGDIDVMMDVPGKHAGKLGEEPETTLASAVGPHLWFLILNTREGVLSDQRVRQAVNYAIDKRRIVEDILGGGAEIAAGPIPSAFGLGAPVAPYPYDPDKARDLIRAAGAEGASLTFFATQDGAGMLDPLAMATAIQKDLSAVGLAAKVQTYEWNTFLSNVNPGLSGKADMAEMAWTVTDPDTLPYLALRSGAVPTEGGFNSGYYSNPEVDRLIEEAHATSDHAARAKLYGRIQAIVHDDAPWAFVASARETAASGPGIAGLVLEPTFLVDFRGVTKD